MDDMHPGALVLVVRIAVGVLFLQSSLGKLRAPRAFVVGVESYDVLPSFLARAVGWLLPWLELGLAAMLLAGFALPLAGALASLLLFSFMIAVGDQFTAWANDCLLLPWCRRHANDQRWHHCP